MKLIIFFIICIVYLVLTIIHKDNNKFKSVKKVRFNLDKNDIILIPNNNEHKYDIHKKIKCEKENGFIDFQKDYVKKLCDDKEKTDEIKNIFKNQKPYWESLEIDLNRSYDNYQVNKFNNIRNENLSGKEIYNVYNNLTYSSGKNKSNLLHNDSYINLNFIN